MLILLPVILMILTALTLLVLRFAQPKFKYPWMLAAGGATLAFASLFLWRIHFPQSLFLHPWQPTTVFSFTPAWLADDVSWSYALALAALAAAVIWTSVVRAENDPMSWAGTLILTAFGILAVAAENPLTLLLAWSAIDLFELIIQLRSAEGEEQSRGIVIAFATRLAGTSLLIWASISSAAKGIGLDFRFTPSNVGIFLLIAVGLRLGVLPLHLPYRKDNILRRGFGTALRLVSAAASLALLARIPASALKSSLTPYLLVLTAIAALYAGWMWLRASDEIVGRPFWVLGLASLAIADSLRGNPTGSIGWGIALILCGGLIFLLSARRKSVLWLPFLGLWALSALPYSLTATAWQAENRLSWLFIIPLVPAQAFLLAGFFRHILHPGETSFESQEKWARVLYPAGLLALAVSAIGLGLAGWSGARSIGLWWLAAVAVALAVGLILLTRLTPLRLSSGSTSGQWTQLFGLERLYRVFSGAYTFIGKIVGIGTSSFEGEGGLLWSFLSLVLILSILSMRGQ